DDLLDVAELVVARAQREQGLDALGSAFADADQDPAGEGDAQLAGLSDHRQAGRGALVRGVLVRAAGAAEVLGDRLEHDALAGGDLPQLRELPAREDTGGRLG